MQSTDSPVAICIKQVQHMDPCQSLYTNLNMLQGLPN